MMSPDFFSDVLPALNCALPGRVHRDVPLADCARWKIGGNAAALIDCASVDDVLIARKALVGRSEPLFIMGDASNMLFDSAGFDGIILRLARGMSRVSVSGTRIIAEAGIWVPSLARLAGNLGLSGLEHTIGIPGTLGGLVTMNGGSQRKGIGLNVSSVDCIDANGNLITLSNEECNFAYRTSALQRHDLIIVSVVLELTRKPRSEIIREMLSILQSRKARFPKSLPNGGSTFLSNPILYDTIGPPGRVIEELGFKGVIHGGAQISPMHANFIVNLGSSSSDDVLALIHLIRERAFEKTGIWMDCEVRHLERDGRLRPAHEAALDRFGTN